MARASTAQQPQRGDFREGVRAVLVDKDGRARWEPATLDAVRPADVDALFAPMGDEDLVLT